MKNILFLIFASMLLTSCNLFEDSDKDKKERIMPESNGKANELLVVIKHDLWKSKLGQEIRNIFQRDMQGLPQPEPLYRVANVDPVSFGSLLQGARNILIIDIKEGDKAVYSSSRNVYAMPQVVNVLEANSEESAIKSLKKIADDLVSSYRDQDLKSVQKRLKKIARTDIPNFDDLGISIILPRTYLPVEFGENFWWYRSDLKVGKHFPSLNFMLYITPLNPDSDMNVGRIIAIRDSIGKKYVPGPTEGSYMQTELRSDFAPIANNVLVDNKLAIETKGLWMVKKDFMGGPFLSYTIFDEKKNRIITAEGFVYAAGLKKRDYVFEMEAIIKSLQLK